MLAAQSIRLATTSRRRRWSGKHDHGPHFAHVRNGVKFGEAPMKDSMALLTGCAFESLHDGQPPTGRASTASRARSRTSFAQSQQKAAKAQSEGWFKDEIIALTGEQVGNRKVPGPEGGVSQDEGIRRTPPPRVSASRAAFEKDGSVTAGNASTINDGAAAVVVASQAKADARCEAAGPDRGVPHLGRGPEGDLHGPGSGGAGGGRESRTEARRYRPVRSTRRSPRRPCTTSRMRHRYGEGERGRRATLGHPIGFGLACS